jgi:hypothetical protein
MPEPVDSNFDRRRFIKLAGHAAWATPLVLTIASGRAGAQALPVLCGEAGVGGCPNTPACTSPAPVCREDPALQTGQCGCFFI